MPVSLTELLKTSSQADGPGGVSTEMPDLTANRDSGSRKIFSLFNIVFISLPTSVGTGCKVGATCRWMRFKCNAVIWEDGPDGHEGQYSLPPEK